MDDKWNYSRNITIQIAIGHGPALHVRGLVTRDFWLDISDHPTDFSVYHTVLPHHAKHLSKKACLTAGSPKYQGLYIR
jgi:hypothetical protein